MAADKIGILKHVCENPGWSPAALDVQTAQFIEELGREGWIAQRLDGHEATAHAMECHPNFYYGEDGKVHGEPPDAPPPQQEKPELPEQVIDLSKAALWCDYCKAMVQLVRRGPGALAPDALGCMGCGRVIGHANFWKP